MTQLKTHIIETPKARVLVVDIPEGAYNLKLIAPRWETDWEPSLNYELQTHYAGDDNNFAYTTKHGEEIDLPKGNWQLLGRLSEITEDQTLATIVGRGFKNYNVCQQLNQHPQYDMYWVKYPDGSHKHFNTKDECYAHALKMELLSLIESEVFLGNPYEKPRIDNYRDNGRWIYEFADADYENEVSNWQAAEDQVFHNPLIFWEKK